MNEHDATETAYKNGYEKAKQDIIENINTRIAGLEKLRDDVYKNYAPLSVYAVLRTLEELKKEIENDRENQGIKENRKSSI